MLIIYRGNGAWAAVILLACSIVPVIGAVVLDQQFPNAGLIWLVALAMDLGPALGGFVCWRLGKRWNRGLPDQLAHTLYFIRVEHWGIAVMSIAAGCAILPLVVIAVVSMLVHFKKI